MPVNHFWFTRGARLDNEKVILLDIYEKLLTPVQADVLRMRLDEDLSLGEIGEICNISRQGVLGTVKKAEEKLAFYESALQIAEKDRRLREVIRLMEENNENAEYIRMLKEIAGG